MIARILRALRLLARALHPKRVRPFDSQGRAQLGLRPLASGIHVTTKHEDAGDYPTSSQPNPTTRRS